MAIEYDDFYGDQSSESDASSGDDDDDGDRSFDDGCTETEKKTPSDPFGRVANYEYRSLESSIQTLSYLDGYDETKELKLQEGFSDGYRKSFHDAFRIGQCLGSLCATAARDELMLSGVDREDNSGSAGNTDQSATKKLVDDPAILVRNFLREEILIGSKDKGNETKYDEALLQLVEQLSQIRIQHAAPSHHV
ncbi:hypothetical protein ACHAWU_001788 [Discostella pseudostelligera]|uniref:Essential protein Yae1 N-terminal domain-containing protein n=1 Tax=Discostella pseudostelligera TaxID=259834 RepID=A0ABD3M7U4_9STRA